MQKNLEATANLWPILANEQLANTVEAQKYHFVCQGTPRHIEGVIFDRSGTMYFCDSQAGRVLSLNMETREEKLVWEDKELCPTAVKIHRDGRLFIACLGTPRKSGRIVITTPDGTELGCIGEGHEVDDMVFDSEGNIYYGHMVGNVFDPKGAIYHVTPDLKTESVFLSGLCSPNGICLSVDGSYMWITEFTANRLLKLPMSQTGDLTERYASAVYYFTGFYGPDSISVDADDNLYVSLFDQGRVMIFSKFGHPIAQILMPGREEGRNLGTAHAMVRPDTKEVYIATCDDYHPDEGNWIMKAPALGYGNKKAFQFL